MYTLTIHFRVQWVQINESNNRLEFDVFDRVLGIFLFQVKGF